MTATIIKLERRIAFFAVFSIAIWWGMNPFAPWGADVVIFGAIAIGASFLIFVVRMLFGGWTAFWINWWLIAICAVTAWQFGSLRNTVLPQMATYTLTSNIPVKLNYEQVGGTIWATITNEDRDWLSSALVSCQLFMDNGTPIDRDFSYAIGNGYMGAGESWQNPIVADYEIQDVRADIARTRCHVAQADFMRRPSSPSMVDVTFDTKHDRHIYTVHNLGDRPFRNVLIQCKRDNGMNEPVTVTGRWSLDPRTTVVVPAHGSAQFTDADTYDVQLSACQVLSSTFE